MKYMHPHDALALKIDGAIESNIYAQALGGCGLLDIEGIAHDAITVTGKHSATATFTMPFDPQPEDGDHVAGVYVDWRETWPSVTLSVDEDDLLLDDE